jgi:retinol dehydrogenase-12
MISLLKQIFLGIVGCIVLQFVLKSILSPKLSLVQNQLLDFQASRVLITGACSGIGRQTASLLYQLNYSIILGCRSVESGVETCHYIRSCSKSINRNTCVSYPLDLASFTSVRNFAKMIVRDRLDVNIIINNAGLRQGNLQLTEDSVELHYQVNHLSHFLLFRLLLPTLLKSSYPKRVVHVSSSAHSFGIINQTIYNHDVRNTNQTMFDWVQSKSMEGVYADTKLMQILFSNEIQRRFGSKKSYSATSLSLNEITSVAVHPGFVNSNMGHNDQRLVQKLVLAFRPFISRSTDQAAVAVACGLFESSAYGGQYMDNCKPMRPKHSAYSLEDAEWLWNTSSKIVGHDPIDDEETIHE